MTSHSDDVLSASAPALAHRTARLREQLVDLVAETESAAHRPRRPLRRLALVLGLLLSASAVTAGASAVGLVPTPGWAPWTNVQLDSRIACGVTFDVAALRSLPDGITADDQGRAVEAAEIYLAALPIDEQLRNQAQDNWAEGFDGTQSQIELASIQAEVNSRVTANLAERGLEPRAIFVSTATRCDGGPS